MHHIQLLLGLLVAAGMAPTALRRLQQPALELAPAAEGPELGLLMAGFASMGLLVLALGRAIGPGR